MAENTDLQALEQAIENVPTIDKRVDLFTLPSKAEEDKPQALDTENYTYHKISEDPNAPLVRTPKSHTPEQVEEYLSSERLSEQLFNQGYIYLPGLSRGDRAYAEPIKAYTMEEEGDFARGFKNALSWFPTIYQSAKNIWGDITNNEALMKESQRMMTQYQTEAIAKGFYTDDAGNLKPYGTTLEEIFQDTSGEKLEKFIDWGQSTLGSGIATWLPTIILGGVGFAVGGPVGLSAALFGSGFLYGLGEVREAQLEITDDPNTVETLLGAGLYGAAEKYLGGPGLLLKNILVKKVGKETTDKIFKRIAKRGLESSIGEGVTEVAQQSTVEAAKALEKAQDMSQVPGKLKETFTDPEVLAGIREAGYAGTFVGGVLGGGGGILPSRSQAAIDAAKRFENLSQTIQGTNTKDPDIAEYRGKVVTVSDIIDTDEKGKPLVDKDGNQVIPEFLVLGTQEIDGVKYVQLINKNGNIGTSIPSMTVKLDDIANRLNIKEEPATQQQQTEESINLQVGDIYLDKDGNRLEVKEIQEANKNLGITQKTILTKDLDRPNREIGTDRYTAFLENIRSGIYKKQEATDSNPTAEQNPLDERTKQIVSDLTQRGFDKKFIQEELKKDPSGKGLLDYHEGNYNQISQEEQKILDELGYYQGALGERYIQRLQNTTEKLQGTNKTRGRERLEKIIKDKIPFEAKTIKVTEAQPQKAVPPTSRSILKQAGYTIGPIKYTRNEFNTDLATIDQEEANAQTEQDKESIRSRRRYLKSLYKISKLNLEKRFQVLKSLITNKGVDYSVISPEIILDNGERIFITPQKLPAQMRAVENNLQTTLNRTNIRPEDKQQLVETYRDLLEKLRQYKSDIDVLFISLGQDVLPLEQFSTLSMGNKAIKQMEVDVKGKIIKSTKPKYKTIFSPAAGNPSLNENVTDDLQKIEQAMREELQRLGLTAVDLEVVEQFLYNQEPQSGGFLIDYTAVDVSTRLYNIGRLLTEGMGLDEALQYFPPHGVAQNKIIISAGAKTPRFLKEVPTDPRLFTLHHEAIHMLLRNDFFTKEEIKILFDAAQKRWIKQYNLEKYPEYKIYSKEQLMEEAIANAFALYMANKYKPRGRIAAAFYRLKAYLNSLASALFSSGYTSPNEIFDAIDLKEIQTRKYKNEIKNLVSVSYENAALLSATSNDNFKKFFKNSYVKGGTPNARRMVGSQTQNILLNISIKSPAFRKRIQMTNLTANDPRLVVMSTQLLEILDRLTGKGRDQGYPEAEDIVEIDSLINDLRQLIQDIGYKGNTNLKFNGMAVEQLDPFLEQIGAIAVTPSQKLVTEALYDLYYTNNTPTRFIRRGETFVNSFEDRVRDIFSNRLTPADVASANGPMVVYHGTDKTFSKFEKTNDLGFHTGTKNTAQSRIILSDIDEDQGMLMPLYVSIQNPLRMRDLGSWLATNVLDELTIPADTRGARLYKDAQGRIFSISDGTALISYSNLIAPERNVLVPTVSQLIFTQEEAAILQNKFVKEAERVKDQFRKRLKTAKIEKEADPYADALKVSMILGTEEKKLKFAVNKALSNIIVAEIKKKGFDGIVYLNQSEADVDSENVGGPADSYIAFDSTQIKSVRNSGAYDTTNPDIYLATQYNEDPSDIKMEQPEPYNRGKFLNQYRQMLNLQKQDNVLEPGFENLDPLTGAKKFGIVNRVLSHARVWAMQFPIFTPLFNTWNFKQEKAGEIQTRAVDDLHINYMPAMRNKQTATNLIKAFEISQQVPGRYRPDRPLDEGGTITFIAREDGKGAGSEVKAGDTVILSGDAAQAYLDLQLTLQTVNKEIVKGMLANENIKNNIDQAITILLAMRPDLQDNPILNTPVDKRENFEYADIKFILDELKNPSTYLQPAGVYDKNLFNLVDTLISKEVKEEQKDKVVVGLNGLLSELATYQKFKTNDYMPLQRYGNKFIAVKDAEGNLIDYRMFESGVFFGKLYNEERGVRAELQKKYPSIDISKIKTQDVTISNVRRELKSDLQTLDDIAQFMSDRNSRNYVDIRKELEATINKRVGGDIRGYNIFMKPRKEVGGVPGFSTDFGRAISQYINLASQFAAQNRFKTTELRMLNYLQKNAEQEPLKKAVEKWYEYAEDPKQELARLRKLGFWWYLGGNASSALLQTATILQMTGPYLTPFAGPVGVGDVRVNTELLKAVNDVRKMMVFPVVGKYLTGKDRKFQDVFLDFSLLPDDIREDAIRDIATGLIKQGAVLKEAAMPSGGVTYQSRSKAYNAYRNFENVVMGGMFNTFETMSRLTAYIATQRLARNKKYGGKFMELMDDFLSNDQSYLYNKKLNNNQYNPRMFAQHVINETFGMYGKGNRPWLMRGFGSLIFLFNTYVSQMFSLMYRMATNKGGPKTRLMGQKIFARQLLNITLTGGLVALPFVDDAEWLAKTFFREIVGVERDFKQEYRRFMMDHGFGPGLIEAIESGTINKLTKADLSRRVRFTLPVLQQVKGALTLLGVNSGVRGEEAIGAFGSLLFGNARGILYDAKEVGEILNPDFATRLVSRVTPTFIKNLVQGTMYMGGAPVTTSSGTLIADELTFYEAFLKTLGFNPTTVARRQEALRLERINGGRTAPIRTRFNNRITNNLRDLLLASKSKDSKKIAEAQQEQIDIMVDLIKFNDYLSREFPGTEFVPDLYLLLQEALKDLHTEIRISSGDFYELVNNYFDYQALGIIPALD